MRTDPYWWNRLELNQRHPELQSGALPTELRFHVAESAELESDAVYGTIRLAGGPQTFWVHSPNSGWDGWIRTNDAGVKDRFLNRLATSQYMAGAERVEHSTYSFGDCCATSCAIPPNGDACGARTRNFQLERLAS